MRRNRWPLILYTVFALVLWTALLGASASGMTGHSVFFFDYANGTGFHTGFTVDASGNIWGLSAFGGAYGYGNVFQLTRSTGGQLTENVLYSFTGGNDGGTPIDDDGPLIDSAGNVYGTTSGGGTYNGGTVFKLTHSSSGWQESVLWNFTCGNDGCGPEASLVSDSAGILYGTTSAGGPGGIGYGTVFELSPDGSGNWKETSLHIFSGAGDGAGPLSSLIFDRSGNLYGATSAGGYYTIPQGCDFAGFFGCGVIFKLTRGVVGEWEEQVLYAFQDGNDGAFPSGKLVFDASGNIYGVSEFAGNLSCNFIGCGTVFRLAPPASSGGQWNLSTLHAFTGGSDGASPVEGVIVDRTGVVYGTATGGGKGKCLFGGTTGCGTLYRIAPTVNGRWNFELLYSFLGRTDGGVPFKITFVGSSAYTPTGEGGSDGSDVCRHTSLGSCGTIFQLSTTSQ
jgi:uncharacterized repeat protein (TIGR03803 family)